MLDFPEFCFRQDMFFDNTLSLFVSQSFSPFLSMDGKNETGRNKIKAHYSESSKFRQSPCLAEQGFPILASFPLRRPPHPRKMGEGAVSGGARHGTLTKKGAGWGLTERMGKPWEEQEPGRHARIVPMSVQQASTHYLPPRQDPRERSYALDTRLQGR